MSVPWAVARRDVEGMPVRFDIGGPVRVVKIVIDTEGDGEPGWEFTAGPTTDYRAFRGINVKPVVNGVWDVSVTATDARGCTATLRAPQPVTVVVGGR